MNSSKYGQKSHKDCLPGKLQDYLRLKIFSFSVTASLQKWVSHEVLQREGFWETGWFF